MAAERRPRHLCHARNCPVAVAPRMLMCSQHWKMVPKHLQHKLWGVYVSGQEVTKTPTRAYLAVALECVSYVADLERTLI